MPAPLDPHTLSDDERRRFKSRNQRCRRPLIDGRNGTSAPLEAQTGNYQFGFLKSEEVVEGQATSCKALSNLQVASLAVAMSVVQVKKSLIVPEKFEAGATDLKLVDVVDRRQDAPFTAGVIEIKKSTPTEFDYDNDCAVIYCTEGSIILKEGGKTTEVQAGDVVYIPQKKGLKVEWSTPSSGRGFYVTYPHWR